MLGIALTHMQDLPLGLVELHDFLTGTPLKPVKVLLDCGCHIALLMLTMVAIPW